MSNTKFTFEEVKEAFDKRGYVLLEKEYKNNRTLMKFHCPKHPDEDMFIRFDHMKRGVGCWHCGNDQKALKMKFGFDEVKNAFDERGYILLETKYKNNKTKMKYICPKHVDKELRICFSDLKSGYGCIYCAGKAKYSFSYVKEQFAEKGYVLLETDYKNNHSPLKYHCPEHADKELFISFTGLLSGQGCAYCAGQGKPEFSEVVKEFNDRNYALLSTEYLNSVSLLKYRCLKHPENELSISFHALKRSKGSCNSCYVESITGDGSHFWKGGVNTLSLFLRNKTKEWKMNILKQHNYRCDISGENHNNLEVHHSVSFSVIRNEVLKELNMKPYRKSGEYTPEQLKKIVYLFLEKQKEAIGFPLRKDIHKKFHKEYGNNVTLDNYYEFKNNYKEEG